MLSLLDLYLPIGVSYFSVTLSSPANIKIIYSLTLRYAHIRHTNWLLVKSQPIRVLKRTIALMNAAISVCRIGFWIDCSHNIVLNNNIFVQGIF